jgi:hypothetical protein
MKEIKEKTKKIENEYFIDVHFLINFIKNSYKIPEKEGLIPIFFKEGYIEITLLRIKKNEPVCLIYAEHRKVFISYGSAILGLEELLSIFPNDGVKNLCDYFHKKNDESPDFILKNIEPVCFFYTTKSGKEMVNLKGIAKDLGILEDENFKEAMAEVLEEYDPLRFDGVRGSFIPKKEAMAVLQLFYHYSGKKNEKLQEILEKI